jgi:hypothetical protein
MPISAPAKPHCSFCVKSSDEVAKLISGTGVYICDECVRLCNDILAMQSGGDTASPPEIDLWKKQSDQEILDSLPRAAVVSAQADARIQSLVDILRERGVPWAKIGTALGVTRQSAWEKFSAEGS